MCLDALTQSVESLVQTMSGDAVSTKMFLLEDGEIFGPSLPISGENNSNENTTEKDGIVALPDDICLVARRNVATKFRLV